MAPDLGGCLAENGALKVNKHLQVQGFDNIYAVGDCANINEPKMAYHAGLHAGVAVRNIINSLTGKALTSYNTGNYISHCTLVIYGLCLKMGLLHTSEIIYTHQGTFTKPITVILCKASFYSQKL